MSQVGSVTLTGFVTGEPKLRFTKVDQTPVTHVRVGCTTRKVDRLTGEWVDGNTSYFNVNCWRKLAVNVTASLHKGQPVIVKGRFRTRSWEEEGKTRTEVEIDADTIGHDLAVGWAMFQRSPSVNHQIAQELAQGETSRAGNDAGQASSGQQDHDGGWEDPGATRPEPGPGDPPEPFGGHDAQEPDGILDEEAIAEQLAGSFESELQGPAHEPAPA